MRITTPDVLFQEELKDIYDFEKRLVRAIPKMAKAASSEDLRSGLTEHLEVTKNHVQRIEQIFDLLDIKAQGKACDGIKGILAEGDKTLGEVEGAIKDVAIAAASRRVEHYEMAAYSSAKALAEQIGNSEIVDLLQQTWDEEHEADEQLAQVAAQILEATDFDSEDAPAPSRKPAGKSAKSPKSRRAQG